MVASFRAVEKITALGDEIRSSEGVCYLDLSVFIRGIVHAHRNNRIYIQPWSVVALCCITTGDHSK